MNLNELSQEQLEKAIPCKSADELVALAESEGIELTDCETTWTGGQLWQSKSFSRI